MDDSAITCDKVAEKTKTFPTNFNEVVCKTQSFYISLAFLLITIASLITVTIYCYLIKNRPKQKNLLPFQVTNNKLKQVMD